MIAAEPTGTVRRLPHPVRLGYASGNFAKSVQVTAIDLLYLYFLVDVMGIAAPVAGAVLFAAFLIDSLTDPLFGHLIDKREGRIGYRTIIGLAAPLCCLAFVAIFIAPVAFPGAVVLASFLSFAAFRVAFTLVDVPHNALLAGITRDSRERGVLSTWRFFFSSLGTLAISAIVLIALSREAGPRASTFVTFAFIVAALYLPVMLGSAAVSVSGSRTIKQPVEHISFLQALRRLLANRRLMQVICVCVISAGLITVFSRMAVFYAKSWLGDPGLAGTLIAFKVAGQVLALPLWWLLAKRTEKRTAAICAQTLFGGTMAAFLLLAPRSVEVSAVLFFLAGAGLGGLTVMNWALLPDTIEYTELDTGSRHEALTFGLLLALCKAASGAGLALVAWLLELSGYEAAAAEFNSRLPDLLLSMTLVPMMGVIACSLILSRLPMSYRDHLDATTAPGDRPDRTMSRARSLRVR